MSIYIINTGYLHPPLDITFFLSGLVLFPFSSCLLCICVPQFSQNTQQPRTFFCSLLQSCATTLAFAQFNYAIITFFNRIFLSRFLDILNVFSAGFFDSLAIEACFTVWVFFLFAPTTAFMSRRSLWVLVTLFLREDTTLAVTLRGCAA